MPPRRGRTNTKPLPTIQGELNELISQAIAQYEANRADQSSGMGGTTGGNPPTVLRLQTSKFDGTGGAVSFVRWTEKTDSVIRMSKCPAEQRVTYVTGLFIDGALSWWNLQVQTKGETAAYGLTWEELKELMRKKYCSRSEIQKLETEFWNLKMIGPDIAGYTQRFHDLSRVVPYLVEPEFKRIERYIWGLAPQILSMVTTSKPTDIGEAIDLAVALTEEALRQGKFDEPGANKKETTAQTSSSNKRKFSHFKKGLRGRNNKNNNNRGEPAKETGDAKAYVTTTTNNLDKKSYAGTAPKCNTCPFHHYGDCRSSRCGKCNKFGHRTEACRGTNTRDQDYSFISKEFRDILGVESSKLNIPYSIELANGELVETGEIIKKCTLELGERKFDIDLLPVPLGSFDVVIGMDWLSDNRAEVICHEKVIRIPLPDGEHLLVHGEKQDTPLRIISCMKA
ncbi:uncharacterized protein LOC110900729 [Helianthus annuus]|uniref:uncharacterized protein LOC110900729 n=1 Tax=Helianthus annuus TaxID=4232 RepID=UPI000B8F9400|nr:uncharacterized protein LOC110900729 [Helianthus annuus]